MRIQLFGVDVLLDPYLIDKVSYMPVELDKYDSKYIVWTKPPLLNMIFDLDINNISDYLTWEKDIYVRQKLLALSEKNTNDCFDDYASCSSFLCSR